jgi:hypothetical protein
MHSLSNWCHYNREEANVLKLENRIDALERKMATNDELTVWIISFVRPGPNGPIESEPIAYVGNDGERWDRQKGETLDQLKERASREVTRSAWGFACLRECYELEDVRHADT